MHPAVLMLLLMPSLTLESSFCGAITDTTGHLVHLEIKTKSWMWAGEVCTEIEMLTDAEDGDSLRTHWKAAGWTTIGSGAASSRARFGVPVTVRDGVFQITRGGVLIFQMPARCYDHVWEK